MNKQQTFISLILISGLLIPVTGFSHNYSQTSGYQSLQNWGTQLRGISFHDNRYVAYCNHYAQVAAKQAKKRITQQCKNKIPTPNSNLRSRWSMNASSHRNWCRSVSAYASGAESSQRENGIRNCLNGHTHVDPNVQIRKNCKANDNMHKKAARGDISFVRKCLNAGVSPNIQEGNRWTPLHSAARNGRLQIVKLLIRRGAGVNARDVTNRTPRDQAKIGGYIATQNFLKRKGGVLSR